MYGIESVRDYYDAALSRIGDAYGSVEGKTIWLAMHGHDVCWTTRKTPKSMSHSRVLQRSIREKAESIARWLAFCGWLRARNAGLRAGKVRLDGRVRLDGEAGERHYQVFSPIQHPGGETEALGATSTAWRALRERCLPDKISVILDDLSLDPWSHCDLLEGAYTFDQPLDDTVARIRERFGVRAIRFGKTGDPTGPYTGLKIAFERVPSLKEVDLFTRPVS